MRLTLALLGLELDVTFGPVDEPATDGASLDGGTTGSIGPVGFTQPVSNVEDVPMPQRTPAWDEPEE